MAHSRVWLRLALAVWCWYQYAQGSCTVQLSASSCVVYLDEAVDGAVCIELAAVAIGVQSSGLLTPQNTQAGFLAKSNSCWLKVAAACQRVAEDLTGAASGPCRSYLLNVVLLLCETAGFVGHDLDHLDRMRMEPLSYSSIGDAGSTSPSGYSCPTAVAQQAQTVTFGVYTNVIPSPSVDYRLSRGLAVGRLNGTSDEGATQVLETELFTATYAGADSLRGVRAS